MNAKTEELKLGFIKESMPFAEQLRKEGKNDREIVGIIYQVLKLRIKRFYQRPYDERLKPEWIKLVNKLDSKAEAIVFVILEKYDIEFKAQCQIGSYRADFLIEDFLVLEIDGPQHGTEKNKIHDYRRDEYMMKLGYEIFRIPIWVFAVDERAAIEAIKERVLK